MAHLGAYLSCAEDLSRIYPEPPFLKGGGLCEGWLCQKKLGRELAPTCAGQLFH